MRRQSRSGRLVLMAIVLALGGVVQATAGDGPAFLGVQSREATERAAGGAVVIRVVAGSPAAEAGLRFGDIIIEFGGETIDSPSALTRRILAVDPGEVMPLRVVRDGREQTLEVELGRRPRASAVPWPAPPTPFSPSEVDEPPKPTLPRIPGTLEWFGKPILGVQLVETTPELRRHLGGTERAGVLVSKVLAGMPAERAGVRVGDLILSVDGQPVASSDELVRALRGKVGEDFRLEVVRDRERRRLEVKIPEPAADRPTGPRA